MLFNEPKLLKFGAALWLPRWALRFSALQRAEIAEISTAAQRPRRQQQVSVLFNEPKLLKLLTSTIEPLATSSFSALQRAEIAEIFANESTEVASESSFSALQRAEIAEIVQDDPDLPASYEVSVLFNEPKLLKFDLPHSALAKRQKFQCSSTSRNC